MINAADMNAYERNGDLHIQLSGKLTINSALQLTEFMEQIYQGRGNIIIHTKNLTTISSNSTIILETLIDNPRLPGHNIYLTGKLGMQVCQDVYRRNTSKHRKKEHNCKNCLNCHCSSQKGLT